MTQTTEAIVRKLIALGTAAMMVASLSAIAVVRADHRNGTKLASGKSTGQVQGLDNGGSSGGNESSGATGEGAASATGASGGAAAGATGAATGAAKGATGSAAAPNGKHYVPNSGTDC